MNRNDIQVTLRLIRLIIELAKLMMTNCISLGTVYIRHLQMLLEEFGSVPIIPHPCCNIGADAELAELHCVMGANAELAEL